MKWSQLVLISATAMIGSATINTASAEVTKSGQAELTAPINKESIVLAAMPGSVYLYLLVGGAVAGVMLLQTSIVRVREDEVGIVSKTFGHPLPPNRQIALNGEMGVQIEVLNPGRHYLFPLLMYKVIRQKAIQIDTDEIGLVKAKDGASLPPGKMFGKIVDCSDFQNGRAFIKNGGQRGDQLAVLRNGIYRINQKLFTVDIHPVTHIHEYEIGLVEAKDGKPLPSGTSFGNAVECSNFEDAQAFISNGGYRGKQLQVLTAGKYAINTELFKIQRVDPVTIAADEVGLVEAKEGLPLPLGQNFGRIVQCNNFQDAQAFISNGGQQGKQLAVIPPGVYNINTELFQVRKVSVVNIPSGEIGLVLAQDGAARSAEQILSRTVESNNFQDAQAFISNGGQKGKQRAILTSGTYRINTELFTVVTSFDAKKHGLKPEQLKVYTVKSDKIGIVTTFDGKSLSSGSIAAPVVGGHDKFQNAQKFIDAGGYRGLQSEILEEGSWNLNPWFAKVEQITLTNIKAGTVGVVISNIGKEIEHEDGKRDRRGFNIVPKGYKGIEKIPLEAGKHPINTRVKSIEIVPAHEITLDWANKDKLATNYDSNLKTLMLRSKDGFSFQLEVTQVINIAPEDAPKLISRVGSPKVNKFVRAAEEAFSQLSEEAVKYSSIQNLVTRVLEPMIGNYFRNSAQDYEALDFLERRNEIQEAATEYIKVALNTYGVQAVGTFINEVDLPDELENRVKAQKIAEVERAYLIEAQETEKERQKLEKEKQFTESQAEIVKAEREREIAEAQAEIVEIDAIARAKAEQLKNDEEIRKREQEYSMETARERDISQIEIDKLREQVQIETTRQELEKKIDLNVFQETLNILSPELYVKIETDKRWAEAFSQFKFTAPQTLINGGGGNNNTEGLNALYSGEFQMQLLGMMTERWNNKSNNSKANILPDENLETELLNSEESIDALLDEAED